MCKYIVEATVISDKMKDKPFKAEFDDLETAVRVRKSIYEFTLNLAVTDSIKGGSLVFILVKTDNGCWPIHDDGSPCKLGDY